MDVAIKIVLTKCEPYSESSFSIIYKSCCLAIYLYPISILSLSRFLIIKTSLSFVSISIWESGGGQEWSEILLSYFFILFK